MSLFNDMLRDLEARGAPMPAAVAPLQPAPARRQRRRWPWLLLAAVIGAGSFATYWSLRNGQPAATAPVASTPAPHKPMPVESPTKPASVATAAPVSANVVPPTPAAAPTVAPTVANPSSSIDTAPLPTKPPAPTPTQPAASSTPDTAPSTVRPVVATATPAAGDFARRLQDVASLLAEGREREAEAELQALLVQEPGHVRARQTLASLYQRQARQDDAISVWRQGLALNPRQGDWAQSLARVLLERGEPAQAATVLAAGAPDVAANTEFHALLGYARQQAGQADLAASTYRDLLAVDASSGPWWLGLALAEQSRGDNVAALTAFRRARSGAGLETRVLRYVDARISALEASEP